MKLRFRRKAAPVESTPLNAVDELDAYTRQRAWKTLTVPLGSSVRYYGPTGAYGPTGRPWHGPEPDQVRRVLTPIERPPAPERTP